MGLFGIGTYQPAPSSLQTVQPRTVGQGFPSSLFTLHPPFGGSWGGLYCFLLDTSIRDPKNVVVTPPTLLGLDSLGTPVVRGYPQMTWGYSTLRPDYWYYLLYTYKQAQMTPPGFQSMVLLQYPQGDASDSFVQVLARWDPPSFSGRSVGAYTGVTLRFTHLGFAQLDPNVPIVMKGTT